MEITFEEAVELLKDGCGVSLECEGYYYEISPADDWIGGDGMEGYISSVLGNVVYDSVKIVLRESINFLSEDGNKVVITG
jgi:hypothetical protein